VTCGRCCRASSSAGTATNLWYHEPQQIRPTQPASIFALTVEKKEREIRSKHRYRRLEEASDREPPQAGYQGLWQQDGRRFEEVQGPRGQGQRAQAGPGSRRIVEPVQGRARQPQGAPDR